MWWIAKLFQNPPHFLWEVILIVERVDTLSFRQSL